MRWIIVTSEATRHIVPAQKYLWAKYLPGIEVEYMDLGNEDVTVWCLNVLRRLWEYTDEHIVFGLDDFLPTGAFHKDRFDLALQLMKEVYFDRFDLGWGPGKNKGWFEYEHRISNYLLCGPTTSYSCSVQFSIWNLKALKQLLNSHGSPWHFEVKGECKAGAFRKPVFTWLESSALSSKRWPGKTNLLGLKREDILELVPMLKYPVKDAY